MDGLAYISAVRRTPYIDPVGAEFFFYFFRGGSLCIVALVLLSLSLGRGRLFLVIVDMIALYFWFSYLSTQVMLH